MPQTLIKHFADLPDPRVARTQRHALLDIVAVDRPLRIVGRLVDAAGVVFQSLRWEVTIQVGVEELRAVLVGALPHVREARSLVLPPTERCDELE